MGKRIRAASSLSRKKMKMPNANGQMHMVKRLQKQSHAVAPKRGGGYTSKVQGSTKNEIDEDKSCAIRKIQKC